MSVTPRLVPDHECKQRKCGATTTGCWDECGLKRYPAHIVWTGTISIGPLPAAPAPTEKAGELPVRWANRACADNRRLSNEHYMQVEIEELRAALAARQAPTLATNGDAIAKSKRILNLVDDYEQVPNPDNRTKLRMALMAEFEVARQTPDSRDAALEEAAKACELAMMKPGGICDGPKAIRALKGPAQ